MLKNHIDPVSPRKDCLRFALRRTDVRDPDQIIGVPMKNNLLRVLIIVIAFTIALSSLGMSGAHWKADSQALTVPAQVTEGLPDNVVDAATALKRLAEGNERWRNTMKRRNWYEERKKTASDQHPFAVVIACMDSRVPPELIFDQGLGDIFVIRVAGPVLNSDELASLEYAVAIKDVKLVLVLGHTECGAVEGAVARVAGPYLPGLLNKIEPAISYVSDEYNHGKRITITEKTNLMRVSLANARIVRSIIPAFGQPDVKVTWGLYYVGCGRVAIEPKDVEPEPDPCPTPRGR
jgi:carbonic anhydrase